jgi:hypothetical protein
MIRQWTQATRKSLYPGRNCCEKVGNFSNISNTTIAAQPLSINQTYTASLLCPVLVFKANGRRHQMTSYTAR